MRKYALFLGRQFSYKPQYFPHILTTNLLVYDQQFIILLQFQISLFLAHATEIGFLHRDLMNCPPTHHNLLPRVWLSWQWVTKILADDAVLI